MAFGAGSAAAGEDEENGDDGYDVDDSTGNSAADNSSGPIEICGGNGNEVEVNGTVYTE